ncbi:MAG TPA: hypothetical protein VKT78_17410, partial [Fimbriimonadaceae bacterium]|nr:hypothetical protein [Fimbriimonadaceae bacterium]
RAQALLILAALPFAALGRFDPTSVCFKRTFKQGAKDTYTYAMGPQGGPAIAAGKYTETITSLTSEGAVARFDFTTVGTGLGTTEPIPPLTSKVGFDNMPSGASIKNGTEFAVFGCLAGIAPNKDAKVGESVTVHWQNESKDVTFDGSGKLASSDASAKTLTVEWVIQMTPSYTTGGEYKLTSTYSLADFSLIKSVGTYTIAGQVMDVKFTHEGP